MAWRRLAQGTFHARQTGDRRRRPLFAHRGFYPIRLCPALNHTSVLQGLKKPFCGLRIGICRQLAAPVLVFWLTTSVLGHGLDGIWSGLRGINQVAALGTTWRALRQVERFATQEKT